MIGGLPYGFAADDRRSCSVADPVAVRAGAGVRPASCAGSRYQTGLSSPGACTEAEGCHGLFVLSSLFSIWLRAMRTEDHPIMTVHMATASF